MIFISSAWLSCIKSPSAIKPVPTFSQSRKERTLLRILQVRGLEAKEDIPCHLLKDEDFKNHIKKKKDCNQKNKKDDPCFSPRLLKLQKILAGKNRKGNCPPSKIAAVYYEDERAVYMKLSQSHDGHDLSEDVFAHELMHGIQHQHYPEIMEADKNPGIQEIKDLPSRL